MEEIAGGAVSETCGDRLQPWLRTKRSPKHGTWWDPSTALGVHVAGLLVCLVIYRRQLNARDYARSSRRLIFSQPHWKAGVGFVFYS